MANIVECRREWLFAHQKLRSCLPKLSLPHPEAYRKGHERRIEKRQQMLLGDQCRRFLCRFFCFIVMQSERVLTTGKMEKSMSVSL